jgi:gentisate 1,2-dioxygenase
MKHNPVFYEYSQAVNPIGNRSISSVPCVEFGATLYQDGPTRVIPLDISNHLNVQVPATGPTLCANFVRILESENILLSINATSELFYVIQGRGYSILNHQEKIDWKAGDFFILPAGFHSQHFSYEDSVLYWVHDAPLLAYLGVRAEVQRFEPTFYSKEQVIFELERVQNLSHFQPKNRVGLILANSATAQTQSITHTLWAMMGILPAGDVQSPHRHQSVAIDLVLDCKPGCYSLVGSGLDSQGRILNAKRIDWKPGTVFITPPGLWHSHQNESRQNALFIPVQDAGLQVYLRSQDIRFSFFGFGLGLGDRNGKPSETLNFA